MCRPPPPRDAAEPEPLRSFGSCGAEADGASGPVAFSARERLVGDYTKGTNFGRDTHESALGSTVTSVRLSVDEIDLLVSRLGSSESPLASSLAGKLTLLRLALAPPAEEPDLAAVAASVGLGALPGDAGAAGATPETAGTRCTVKELSLYYQWPCCHHAVAVVPPDRARTRSSPLGEASLTFAAAAASLRACAVLGCGQRRA